MNINKDNTAFVFIYTNRNGVEERFLTDIMLCLVLLKENKLDSSIHLLIDGFNKQKIEQECRTFNVNVPSITSFDSKYQEIIDSIKKENLFVIVTGHGHDYSKYLSTGNFKNAYAENFYNPIETNKTIKNVLFVWGQCFSGFVYKDLPEVQKNYFVFGASDNNTSKSSSIFFYETMKINNNKYEDLYEKFKSKFCVNIFILIFMLKIMEYINQEIQMEYIETFFKEVSKNYIYITSMSNDTQFDDFIRLKQKGLKKCSNDELIKQYKLHMENVWKQDEKHNFPWLIIRSSNYNKTIDDYNPEIYNCLELQFEIIYCLLKRKLAEFTTDQVSISVKDILDFISPNNKIAESTIMLVYLTLSYAKGVVQNEPIGTVETVFTFQLPFEEIKDFGETVVNEIKANYDNSLAKTN